MARLRQSRTNVSSRTLQSRGMVGFGVTRVGSASGGDAIGPVLSSISAGVPNATDATITWTTNELSTSNVFWGLTTAYAGASSPVVDATRVTSHSVLITGLTTATLYHYKVLSVDNGGNYSFSGDLTFTTA